MANKQGQIVDRSASSGHGVQKCWEILFERNEEAWAAGRYTNVLTDEELVEQMQKWFPKRRSNAIRDVRRVRGRMNRERGGVFYHRYLREGGQVCQATARGLPSSHWLPRGVGLK